MFQQLCLSTRLRVLPRALWGCNYFSSVHERGAGWGQKPNTAQKPCSLTKTQNSAFCGAAPHCPKMNRNSWQELSWVSLHEIVQTGPIEPFILVICNRNNSALQFVIKNLDFFQVSPVSGWSFGQSPSLRCEEAELNLCCWVPHSSCPMRRLPCPEMAGVPMKCQPTQLLCCSC